MNISYRVGAKTLAIVGATYLLTTTYYGESADFEYNWVGGYSITQNHLNRSISWYPEISYAQNFSSAAGSLAIAMLSSASTLQRPGNPFSH